MCYLNAVSGFKSCGTPPLTNSNHEFVEPRIAAPLSPIFALFVASIAANKVQGFAVMKMSGVFSWAPMFAWFFPVPWQFVFGVIPHYWIAKVVWVTEARGNPWAYVAVALGFQFGLLLYLMRRFERVACR